MSETLPTTTANTETITSEEAAKRLRALITLDDEVMRYLLVKRKTLLPDESNEINAIHSMRLALMVFAYYSEFPVEGINPYEAAFKAVLHDMPEGRANDMATLTASEADLQQKARNEAKAMHELQQEVGPDWPRLMGVLHEYEEQRDKTSRAVRLFDKLDPGFTHIKNGGAALHLLGVHSPHVLAGHDARLTERFSDLIEENPDLGEILSILREYVGDIAFNGYEQLVMEFDS